MDLYERKYGQRGEAPILDTAIRLLKKQSFPTSGTYRILDAGAGNMLLTERFIGMLKNVVPPETKISCKGWDLSNKGVGEAKERGLDANLRDITKPLQNGEENLYDMIVFLEVLEHVVGTDEAVQNIHTLLKPGGLLVLSTPNLASWYNRLFLLFGDQPHSTEVSTAPVRFGNRITHKLLGEVEGETDIAAGHLRVFTWKALKEFLVYYKFNIVGAKGCSNHKFDLITRVFSAITPSLSGDICVIAKK